MSGGIVHKIAGDLLLAYSVLGSCPESSLRRRRTPTSASAEMTAATTPTRVAAATAMASHRGNGSPDWPPLVAAVGDGLEVAVTGVAPGAGFESSGTKHVTPSNVNLLGEQIQPLSPTSGTEAADGNSTREYPGGISTAVGFVVVVVVAVALGRADDSVDAGV